MKINRNEKQIQKLAGKVTMNNHSNLFFNARFIALVESLREKNYVYGKNINQSKHFNTNKIDFHYHSAIKSRLEFFANVIVTSNYTNLSYMKIFTKDINTLRKSKIEYNTYINEYSIEIKRIDTVFDEIVVKYPKILGDNLLYDSDYNTGILNQLDAISKILKK